VGPRPEVPKYLDSYRDGYENITEIRPGLSDFASIKYRNEEQILSSHEDTERCYREVILLDKLDLAVRYCGNISLRTDLGIILDTIKCIINPQIMQITQITQISTDWKCVDAEMEKC